MPLAENAETRRKDKNRDLILAVPLCLRASVRELAVSPRLCVLRERKKTQRRAFARRCVL
jgi:hypothetical protein